MPGEDGELYRPASKPYLIRSAFQNPYKKFSFHPIPHLLTPLYDSTLRTVRRGSAYWNGGGLPWQTIRANAVRKTGAR
jgi:hypothetical protein